MMFFKALFVSFAAAQDNTTAAPAESLCAKQCENGQECNAKPTSTSRRLKDDKPATTTTAPTGTKKCVELQTECVESDNTKCDTKPGCSAPTGEATNKKCTFKGAEVCECSSATVLGVFVAVA